MQLFRHETRQKSERSKRTYARYEMLHTAVDFGAAFCFVTGSVLFFFDATAVEATWLFLVGSILFAAKPTIRVIREIHLWRIGDYADLSAREQ